ncbi:hypothetical protein [Acinetobacter sp. MD2(2019)]|uniref:hypothetical protein n=1 Tax=Acinetobacter sp. MD2(2019) TaxID=2605273 RepID=UPI002D1F290C|nr:hypothetical protein [Acinetobacter sp. MD2(2019)]MEB3754232.1 hypothetical protein [Acinetobacter sp. MD2(2019)]
MKNNEIQHQGSLKKATLIASLIAPLPFIVEILVFVMMDFHLSTLVAMFGILLGIILFAVPFTLTINFVLVLPMALLLRKINYLSSVYLCFWCSLIAFPAFAMYMRILNGESIRNLDFLTITLTTLCGLCSGIVFCRIARIQLKPFRT